MALVTCPECGKEISDKAESCPHCGCPIQTEKADIIIEKKNKNKLKIIIPSTIILIIILIGTTIYYQGIFKPKQTYKEAVSLLSSGKYDEANKLFETISTYNDVPELQTDIKYESMVYQCITSLKQYLKNPDSLQIYDISFYKNIKDNVDSDLYDSIKGFDVLAESNPVCIIRFGGQNGFGGNTADYGLFVYSKDSDTFEFAGNCKSLDIDEVDDDEKTICKTINIFVDNFEIIGKVDLNRIKNVIKNESYSTIKIIK